jgi:hypothetical protein
MKNIFALAAGLVFSAAMLATPAEAHHSPAAFNLETRDEVTGVVKKATFRNPHGHIDLVVTDESGQEVVYELETSAANLLRRRGWDFSKVKRGETVTAIGHPHKEQSNIMYIRAIRLSDGTMFGDPDGKDQALD